MLNIGNPNIQVGVKQDTGRKWVDPTTGAAFAIFEKTLSVGALPNNTTKNVAHSETINVAGKYAQVTKLWASNGTIIKSGASVGVTADINATNVVVATTTDLTTYTVAFVTIEFCAG